MKKPKHADIDRESVRCLSKMSPELLKAVLSASFNEKTKQKTRKQKTPGSSPQGSVVDLVEEEVGQRVPPERFRDLIGEPVQLLDWTKDLPGYEDARLSAENAMRRIYAATDAAHAGFKAGHPVTVLLDRFFYKIRSGSIQSDSSEILDMLRFSQQTGKTEAYLFIQRLADELKNAKRRVPGAVEFSEFRAQLAKLWMREGLWLMSDDLIARIANVSRQGVAKAVKELRLVKHPDTPRAPIVNGLDENGVFIFREGYPPKS